MKNKKMLIGLLALILLFSLVYGVVTEVIKSTQIRKAPQGELVFYVMHENDINDSKLKEWIEKKYKVKGVHVYKKNRSLDEKYVLLSTGEQQMQGIDINMKSVVGFKNKILINGRVTPPKAYSVKEKDYPYKLIRIESRNDPREIQIGTTNLYDVQDPIRISLDNGIVKEVNGDTIEIATFKQETSYHLYTLTDKALKDLRDQDIVKGDLVSIDMNTDLSEGYPSIENIRKTNKVIEKIKINKISKENKTITVEVNKTPFIFRYKEELQSKVNDVREGAIYLMKLEEVGDLIYISDIIGRSSRTSFCDSCS